MMRIQVFCYMTQRSRVTLQPPSSGWRAPNSYEPLVEVYQSTWLRLHAHGREATRPRMDEFVESAQTEG